MPTIAEIPGQGQVRFEDDWSQPEIQAWTQKTYGVEPRFPTGQALQSSLAKAALSFTNKGSKERSQMMAQLRAENDQATWNEAHQSGEFPKWLSYASGVAQGVAQGIPQIPQLLGEGLQRLGAEESGGAIRRAGDSMAGWVDQNYPTDPTISSSVPYALAQGAGQILPLVATAGGATVLKLPSLVGAAVKAGALAKNFAAESADAQQASLDQGDNSAEAYAKALLYGAGSTAIEYNLGIGRIAKALGVGSSDAEKIARATASNIAKAVGKEGLVGAGQEGAQRMLQESIVKETVNPANWDWQGIGTEALVGGILQAPFGGIGVSVNRTQAIDTTKASDVRAAVLRIAAHDLYQEGKYTQAIAAVTQAKALEDQSHQIKMALEPEAQTGAAQDAAIGAWDKDALAGQMESGRIASRQQQKAALDAVGGAQIATPPPVPVGPITQRQLVSGIENDYEITDEPTLIQNRIAAAQASRLLGGEGATTAESAASLPSPIQNFIAAERAAQTKRPAQADIPILEPGQNIDPTIATQAAALRILQDQARVAAMTPQQRAALEILARRKMSPAEPIAPAPQPAIIPVTRATRQGGNYFSQPSTRQEVIPNGQVQAESKTQEVTPPTPEPVQPAPLPVKPNGRKLFAKKTTTKAQPAPVAQPAAPTTQAVPAPAQTPAVASTDEPVGLDPSQKQFVSNTINGRIEQGADYAAVIAGYVGDHPINSWARWYAAQKIDSTPRLKFNRIYAATEKLFRETGNKDARNVMDSASENAGDTAREEKIEPYSDEYYRVALASIYEAIDGQGKRELIPWFQSIEKASSSSAVPPTSTTGVGATPAPVSKNKGKRVLASPAPAVEPISKLTRKGQTGFVPIAQSQKERGIKDKIAPQPNGPSTEPGSATAQRNQAVASKLLKAGWSWDSIEHMTEAESVVKANQPYPGNEVEKAYYETKRVEAKLRKNHVRNATAPQQPSAVQPVDITAALAQAAPTIANLGASFVEDTSLDRAAVAGVTPSGEFYVRYNRTILGQAEAQAEGAALAIMREEIVHIAAYHVLQNMWKQNGRQQILTDFINEYFGEIGNRLPTDVKQALLSTYDPNAQAEELGAEYIRALVQQARYGNITERFLSGVTDMVKGLMRQIGNFLSSNFGGDPLIKQTVSEIQRVLDQAERGQAVAREQVQAGAGTENAAAKAFTSAGAVAQAKSFPDIPQSNKDVIDRTAGAQVDVFEPSISQRITGNVMATARTIAQATYKQWMDPIDNLLQVSRKNISLQNLSESEQEVAAHMIADQDLFIRGHRENLWAALERRRNELTSYVQQLPKAMNASTAAQFISAVAEKSVKDFNGYLQNLVSTGKVGDVLAAKAAQVIASAKLKTTDKLIAPAMVENVLRQIAANPAITTAGKTVDQIVADVRTVGGITLPLSQAQHLDTLIGDANGNGINGLPPILTRIKNLGNVIDALRDITNDSAAATKAINDFQSWFGKNQKVSVREWAASYRRLRNSADKARRLAHTISSGLSRTEQRIEGLERAMDDIDALIQTPRYENGVKAALDKLGITTMVVDQKDGSKWTVRGPISGMEYQILMTPTAQNEAANRTSILSLLSEIEVLKTTPNVDPLKVKSYMRVADTAVATWLNANVRTEHANYYNFDPKNFLGWFRTRQSLVEQVGTRSAQESARDLQSIDALADKLRKEAFDSESGDFRRGVLKNEALKAHGISLGHEGVSTYEELIANPLAASYQNFSGVPLKVGDTTLGGMVIMREDMALLDAQWRHEQRIRKIIENPLDNYGMPVMIEDDIQGVKVSRRSAPTGPKTLARGLFRWSTDLAIVWGRNSNDINSRASILQRAFSDPVMFRRLVLGYVTETDQNFKRESAHEEQLRLVSRQIRNGQVKVGDFADLVNAIAANMSVPAVVIEPELRKALSAEVAAYMDTFSKNISPVFDEWQSNPANGQPQGSGGQTTDSLRKFLITSLKVDGSFVKPRTAMLAPSTFYRYARIDSYDIAALRAGAKNAATARAIDSMQKLQSSFVSLLSALEAELKDAVNTKAATTRQAEKLQKSQRNAGDIRFTIAELKTRIATLGNEINKTKTAASMAAEELLPTARDFLREVGRLIIPTVLSAPKAFVNNFIGGTVAAQMLMEARTRGVGHMALAPFRVSSQVAGILVGAAIKQVEKIPGFKSLTSNAPFMRATRDFMMQWYDEASRERQRLLGMGANVKFDWRNRMLANFAITGYPEKGTPNYYANAIKAVAKSLPDSVRNLGIGTTTYTNETYPTLGWHWLVRPLKAFNDSFTQPLVESWSPTAIDKGANIMNAMYAQSQIRWLGSFAKRIAESRGPNASLDPNDPAMVIKPEELGLTKTSLYWLREYWKPAGSLEGILFDYYKRWQAAPVDQRENVPVIDDEQRVNGLVRSLGQRMNMVRETNSPTTFKLSAEWRMIGTFKNYFSNSLDQLAKVIPHPGNREVPKEVFALLALLGMLILAGVPTSELGSEANELLLNRMAGSTRLANVEQDIFSKEGARYAMMATSGLVPFGGNIVDRILGGGSSRSIFDASQAIIHLGFAKDVGNAVTKIAQSGDVFRPTLDLINRYGGSLAAVANRLPVAADDQGSRNASRVLRAATPADVQMREISGGGSPNATPLNMYLRQAETAAYGGNAAGVRSALNKAVQYKVRNKGIPLKDAEAQVRQQVASMQPLMRVYGRVIPDSELKRVTSRMSGRQLAAFQQGQKAYQLLQSSIKPSTAKRKYSAVTSRKPTKRTLTKFA